MKDKVVYRHRNSKTLEVFYIGSGLESRARSASGKYRSRFYQDYIKVHGKPITEIVAKDLSREDALELEEFATREYGRTIDGTGPLLNIRFGNAMSEEQKNKIVSSETKAKMSKAHIGKKFSKETKAKMSIAQKMRLDRIGMPLSDETKAKISKNSKRQNKDKICINNGKINKYIHKDDPIPNRWWKGKMPINGKRRARRNKE
tara:strand:- start:15 stop:623 length:609 start_codon:yes stop_codon:yes gene_type:complete